MVDPLIHLPFIQHKTWYESSLPTYLYEFILYGKFILKISIFWVQLKAAENK